MTRTALITGATDGIGKAVASKLLAEGWEVVVVGRNPERCAATVAELKNRTGKELVSSLVADLTVMRRVAGIAEAFLANHDRLDFLFLNANAIDNERVITPEGFESSFAIGYLGRALLSRRLQTVLEATPGSQVMTVVGLNTERLDFDDLTMERGFAGKSALGRWQWATQVFTGEFECRSPVAMNIYMPGLVKTKILDNEPQPRRTLVKVMNVIVGIPVEKAADNVFSVLEEVSRTGARDVTFAWKKRRAPLDLKEEPGDAERLWTLTEDLLRPYER
jgi:NAD(P)-dependent dehydrogenase (short-subunit alcohol dehydrogenase family)